MFLLLVMFLAVWYSAYFLWNVSYSESNGKFYFYRCIESSNGILFTLKRKTKKPMKSMSSHVFLVFLISIFLFDYLATISNNEVLVVTLQTDLVISGKDHLKSKDIFTENDERPQSFRLILPRDLCLALFLGASQ